MDDITDKEMQELLEILSDSKDPIINKLDTESMTDEELKDLLEKIEEHPNDPVAAPIANKIKEKKRHNKNYTYDLSEQESEEEPEATVGAYQLPIRGGKVLSHFVTKEQAYKIPGAVASLSKHPNGHEGTDIVVPGFNVKNNPGFNAPVYPIAPGTVIKINAAIGENIKGGITCTIRHSIDTNLTSFYGHLNKVNVSVGDKVTTNTVIGLNGDTGSAKGTPHVHLSTTLNGTRVDPMSIIGKAYGSLSKKASFYTRIHSAVSKLEELIKKNTSHQ